MSGKVIPIDVHPNFKAVSPKGSAWMIYSRHFSGGSSRTCWSFVVDDKKGLTAHEAWSLAKLPGNPPFCEVACAQLASYPLSVDTKPAIETLWRMGAL